jgi:uncharacterized membrane protein (GlpM family)
MTDLLRLVRFEFAAFRINVWPMAFMSALVIAMVWVSSRQEPMGLAVVVPLIPVFFVTYPFVTDERGRHDLLYATLPVRRRTVVLARHLFLLVLQVAAGLVAVAVMAVTSATGRQVDASLIGLALLASFATGSLLFAVQLPVLFWLGFAKSRWIALVPMVAFLTPVALLQLPGNHPTVTLPDLLERSGELLPIAAPILIAVATTSWVASVLAATRLYGKRQF